MPIHSFPTFANPSAKMDLTSSSTLASKSLSPRVGFHPVRRERSPFASEVVP
jgi:hypothetical protein